ncbi:MAG: hypothetical protein AAF721_12140 [Myxococcota bacterium]
MHWSYKANAVSFAALAVAGAVLAAGYLPGDPGWATAGFGACALFAVVAGLILRGVQWAPPVGLGMIGFSLGLWIQSTIALTGFGPLTAEAQTSLATCVGGLLASVIALGLVLCVPRAAAWRHTISMAFAGSALAPGVLFALAPAQAFGVGLAMGVGSIALVAGTVAVGRGRTWGLLLNLVGAAIIATGASLAPWLGRVTAVNPWLPNAHGFLVTILGSTAAGLAALSTALYAVPLLRFVWQRGED